MPTSEHRYLKNKKISLLLLSHSSTGDGTLIFVNRKLRVTVEERRHVTCNKISHMGLYR